jgi:plastocyanin
VKKLVIIIIVALTITLLVACANTSSTTNNNPNTVKTEGGSFSISSITIKKGSTITFVDDTNNSALHILIIGQNAQQESENGSPDFRGASGVRIDVGDSWTTPPWNTAGTYHVACTIHPAMNLTVIVTS